MINYNQVNKILEERQSYHPDDPRIQECWRELNKLLAVDEDGAIKYFNQCSENNILYLSEIFDDLSEHYQSKAFVEFLKTLQSKFPNIDISVGIKYAEIVLKEK